MILGRYAKSGEVGPSPDIDCMSSWIFLSGGARESSLGFFKEGLGRCETAQMKCDTICNIVYFVYIVVLKYIIVCIVHNIVSVGD